MEPSKAFSEQLEAHISARLEELNKVLLPKLQQTYTSLGNVVKIFRANLLKKGVIYDDPYKYDSQMTEIKVPADESFADSERATVIGSRLAQYQTMIEFLSNSYQFNTRFLTTHRVSEMIALSKTFLWASLTDSPSHANTRALGEICKSLQTLSDTLTAGLLRDSLGHISKLNAEIEKILKALLRFQREEYKLQVRRSFPQNLTVTENDIANPTKVLKTLKKHFASSEVRLPFHAEPVFDVLKEDFSADSSRLQATVLKKLQTAEVGSKKASVPEDLRPLLLAGLQMIGSTASHFQACITKLHANQELLYKSRATLFTKFAGAVRKAFNMPEKKEEIMIMMKDAATNLQTKEVIVFEDFEADVLRRIRAFKNISGSGTVVKQKLAGMTESQLSEFLQTYLRICHSFLKMLNGLDEYYKTVDLVLRSKMKGIKIELTTIKNAVIKANQYRAEYAAQGESRRLMKKMGILNE